MTRCLAVAGAAALLAGCAADRGERASEDPAFPRDVVLTVHQYRSDEVNQVLAVNVDNNSDRPVTIDSLDVVAPGFTGSGPVDFGATIGADRSYDLRVPVGTPECDASTPPGEVVVRVRLAGYDGTFDVAPAAGRALMERLHTDMCAIEAALRALPMHWADRWVPTGDRIRGTLVIGPAASEGPVSVSGIAATTLVNPVRHRLPQTVRPGETVRTDVWFVPTRCDGHAFADSKKGFEVPLWLTLDGGQETSLVVQPSPSSQERILTHLLAVCDLD